jgi:hypothetical protein
MNRDETLKAAADCLEPEAYRRFRADLERPPCHCECADSGGGLWLLFLLGAAALYWLA